MVINKLYLNYATADTFMLVVSEYLQQLPGTSRIIYIFVLFALR